METITTSEYLKDMNVSVFIRNLQKRKMIIPNFDRKSTEAEIKF